MSLDNSTSGTNTTNDSRRWPHTTARLVALSALALAIAAQGGCSEGRPNGEPSAGATGVDEDAEPTGVDEDAEPTGVDEGAESTETATGGAHVAACIRGKERHVAHGSVDAVVRRGGYPGRCRIYGDRRSLGDGALQTYVQLAVGATDGKPEAIGVELPETTLTNLPTEKNDGASCFDVDGDGELERDHECVGGHHRVLDLPREAMRATPFTWLGVNWENHGHVPPGIYDVPHFDLHFYIQSEIEHWFIRPGPCSLLVNCDDNDKGNKPLPPQYLPAGYENTELVEARMGGHLVNFARAPEFTPGGGGSAAFKSTLIYGQFDGHLTFVEPMIALTYLQTRPDVCFDIDQPAAFEQAGYYPTRYCVKYSAFRREYTVSLESFVYRPAG